MTQASVFHERKKNSWSKFFWALLMLALAAVLAAYFFTANDWSWSWKTGAKPATQAVVATPLPVAIAPAPAPASTAVALAPVCECKCDCCAKKPVVKKVVKKKPRPVKKQPVKVFIPSNPAPTATVAPQEPRYVPVPYNKPTVLNPETGKMVKTMPLGIQPVLTCDNSKGGVSCAK